MRLLFYLKMFELWNGGKQWGTKMKSSRWDTFTIERLVLMKGFKKNAK